MGFVGADGSECLRDDMSPSQTCALACFDGVSDHNKVDLIEYV